jgi:VIT1/CCC1 family predicted Fe2+/Mn2+ transporter
MWEQMTGTRTEPNTFRIFWYDLMARICGYTFTLKLMESGENAADKIYSKLAEEVPEAHAIAVEEEEHENVLLAVLDEERLQYVGSMVLGLNDALVELTGTLAGLTLAMRNTGMIAMAGLITGVAATLSMASSEYLSARSEGRDDALKSCTYTGVAYCITVALLVAPYLMFGNDSYIEAHGFDVGISSFNNSRLYLLYFCSQRLEFQEAFLGNGGHQSKRSSHLFCHRHLR